MESKCHCPILKESKRIRWEFEVVCFLLPHKPKLPDLISPSCELKSAAIFLSWFFKFSLLPPFYLQRIHWMRRVLIVVCVMVLVKGPNWIYFLDHRQKSRLDSAQMSLWFTFLLGFCEFSQTRSEGKTIRALDCESLNGHKSLQSTQFVCLGLHCRSELDSFSELIWRWDGGFDAFGFMHSMCFVCIQCGPGTHIEFPFWLTFLLYYCLIYRAAQWMRRKIVIYRLVFLCAWGSILFGS